MKRLGYFSMENLEEELIDTGNYDSFEDIPEDEITWRYNAFITLISLQLRNKEFILSRDVIHTLHQCFRSPVRNYEDTSGSVYSHVNTITNENMIGASFETGFSNLLGSVNLFPIQHEIAVWYEPAEESFDSFSSITIVTEVRQFRIVKAPDLNGVSRLIFPPVLSIGSEKVLIIF